MTALLRVDGLWKRYARNLRASLKYASGDIWRSIIGNNGRGTELRKTEFWALRDISFSLRRGEVLAVMGHNGAGKSTLLKCIAGRLKAERGNIDVNGKIGHLIELSAGFVPSLSGRENVRIRGQLQGLRGAELGRYMDAVADFAEIGEFFDAPVQFYSSGMRSRLGFAASSMMQPDILILDEVLAVGDLGFRLRCYERINRMASQAAVLFVSHSLGQISRMCNRALYLEKGSAIFQGDTQQAIALYQDKLGDLAGSQKAEVLNAELMSAHLLVDGVPHKPGEAVDYGAGLRLSMDISKLPKNSRIRILLKDVRGSLLMEWNSIRSNLIWPRAASALQADIGSAELCPGTYSVSIQVMSENGVDHLSLSDPISFKVKGEYHFSLAIQRRATWNFTQAHLPTDSHNESSGEVLNWRED